MTINKTPNLNKIADVIIILPKEKRDNILLPLTMKQRFLVEQILSEKEIDFITH
jgi:hypothetical protein